MAVPAYVYTYIDALIGREGGYSNNKADQGGETMWGVTIAVARSYGYGGHMIDLSRETAVQIYVERYFLLPKLDRINDVFPELAEEMLDTGVNCGQTVPVKFLQRALNVLNRQGKLFPDMRVDGVVGPMTIAALKAFLSARGEPGRAVLMTLMNALQATYYIAIAEERETNEEFVFGWILNRVVGEVA